jgi:hypothetical protein
MNILTILQILEAVATIITNLKEQGHPNTVPLSAETQALIQKTVAPIMVDSEWDANHTGN